MATITPFLWFDIDLSEPIAFYSSIFPDTSATAAHAAPGADPIFSATMTLCGQEIMMLNGGPVHAGFSESISFFVSVDTQEEIDDLWERLSGDGGRTGRCGWLKDRFGLSWQIVPTALGRLLGSPDRHRGRAVMEAMMAMDRLDIAPLQAAHDR